MSQAQEVLEVTPAAMPASRAVSTARGGAMTPAQLLEIAVQQGADLDKLERLMALEERWRAGEAKRAFDEAFAAFKSEAVSVIKGRKVTDGPLKGKSYAELHDIVDQVTPALSRHGLSTSWKITKDDKDWLEVTCTLRHVGGHSEETKLGGPPDTGGAKNAIQARASTVTYLERYTMKAALGISERDDDDDGRGGKRGPNLMQRAQALSAEGRKTGTDAEALKFWQQHRGELAADPAAAAEFKDQMAAHRIELQEAGK